MSGGASTREEGGGSREGGGCVTAAQQLRAPVQTTGTPTTRGRPAPHEQPLWQLSGFPRLCPPFLPRLPALLPIGNRAAAGLKRRGGRTSSASPKNSSPSFFDLGFFVRAKKASSILVTSAPFTSTDAEVEMQYAWFTRLRGTPFSWYGPVTSSRPEDSCLRKTTRLPRKRPPSMISTEPALMVFFSFATPRELASRSLGTFALMSSAGYHLGALTAGTSRSLPFLEPPIAFFTLLERGVGKGSAAGRSSQAAKAAAWRLSRGYRGPQGGEARLTSWQSFV
eukprot:scaffold2062_cov58-Phaeocystis_antarctica.AAC.4